MKDNFSKKLLNPSIMGSGSARNYHDIPWFYEYFSQEHGKYKFILYYILDQNH